MGTIFVGGVHGVGKTDVCSRVGKRLGVPHFSASALIRDLDPSAIKQYTKSVESVPKNQVLLIQAVTQFLAANSDKLILDGHFVVPNMVSQYEVVAANVFNHLHLDAIAVCFDDASQIFARRIARDNNSFGLHEIESIQRMELEHGKLVASIVGIPFFEVKAFDCNALLRLTCQTWQLNPDF